MRRKPSGLFAIAPQIDAVLLHMSEFHPSSNISFDNAVHIALHGVYPSSRYPSDTRAHTHTYNEKQNR
jgi:hypothetical protein